MRHVRSIFYGLVLGPFIWVLLAVGFTDDLSSRGRDFFAAESVSGLLLLIFGGILFTILASGPVSPAGPVLTGAVYLGVTIWAWNSPGEYASLWAPEVAKEGFDLSRPGYGLAAVLAIPLLGTALSGRRWARYEPPVLPIIGEIGRFRGAAKVVGTPVAAEQTTVIRTGGPGRPATVDADRTVAFNAGAGSDHTAALAGGDSTVVVADNDRTVFVAQPPAAPARTPAPVRPAPAPAPVTESEPPTAPTVLTAPVAPVAPVAPNPAPEAEPTTVLAIVSGKSAEEPETAPISPVTRTAEAAGLDGDTFVLAGPGEDRTQASVADPDATRPLQLPVKGEAAPKAATVPGALATPPGSLATPPGSLATPPGSPAAPPDEKTEPLPQAAEPTAAIPAQRRPPAIES